MILHSSYAGHFHFAYRRRAASSPAPDV